MGVLRRLQSQISPSSAQLRREGEALPQMPQQMLSPTEGVCGQLPLPLERQLSARGQRWAEKREG